MWWLCCFTQARACADDALVDVWMRKADAATITGAFTLTGDEACYYFGTDYSVCPGTTYELGDVAATYDDCAACGGGDCECCDTYTIVIGSPYPDATVYGTYDVSRVGDACTAAGSVWQTDPPFDEEAPIVGALQMAQNGDAQLQFDIVNSEGGIISIPINDPEGTEDQTPTGGYCPESYTYPAGMTVMCAD